jgi:sporulation protein YlmC with PRC-barrel domain
MPAFTAAALALPAFAAPPPTLEQQQRREQQRQTQETHRELQQRDTVRQPVPGTPAPDIGEYLGAVEKASTLIGYDVKGADGADLGEVEDVAIDLETGRIVLLVVELGGIAGIGADYVGVPPSEVTADLKDAHLLLNQTREGLTVAARKIDLGNWQAAMNHQALAGIYRSYGKEFSPDSLARPARSALPQSQAQAEQQRRDLEPETADQDRQPVRGSAIGAVERASKLLGAEVVGAAEEDIGEVHDLILDLRKAQVVNVVLASGGFLGIGEQLSVVPPMAFRWDAEDEELTFTGTKDQLSRSPRITGDQWRRQDPTYIVETYRIYELEPVADETGAAADNTRRNVRDRGATLTPIHQGNNETDIDITARIRKQIIDRDGLSTLARNIKVITVDRQVTLRGPVASEAEKEAIGKIAAEVAGAEKVDNQLEVK